MPDIGHLSDTQLMSLIDGEASEDAAHQHLSTCMPCRARRAQLFAIGEELKNIYRVVELPPVGDQRADLQQKLSARRLPMPWWWPRVSGTRWRYHAATLALSICGISLLSWHEITAHNSARLVEIAPDRQLTPGDARSVELSEICSADQDEDLDPEISPALQRRVMEEYGLNPNYPGDFQIDYLINPQLGGTSDLHNLWPEPYSSTAWNAHAKDALETRLHQMVCNGQIGLDEAQRELSSNWISAYKKYFHTDRPLT